MNSSLKVHLMHVLKEIDIKLITFISAGAVIVLSAFALKKPPVRQAGKKYVGIFFVCYEMELKEDL